MGNEARTLQKQMLIEHKDILDNLLEILIDATSYKKQKTPEGESKFRQPAVSTVTVTATDFNGLERSVELSTAALDSYLILNSMRSVVETRVSQLENKIKELD